MGSYGEVHHDVWQVWRMAGANQQHLHAACRAGNADRHVKHPGGAWDQATLHRVMIHADMVGGDINQTHLIRSMTDEIMNRCGLDDSEEPIWEVHHLSALEGRHQPVQGLSSSQATSGPNGTQTQRPSSGSALIVGSAGGAHGDSVVPRLSVACAWIDWVVSVWVSGYHGRLGSVSIEPADNWEVTLAGRTCTFQCEADNR